MIQICLFAAVLLAVRRSVPQVNAACTLRIAEMSVEGNQPDGLYFDEAHFSPDGYAAIADAMFCVLTDMLARAD
jgi:hypothetical protein